MKGNMEQIAYVTKNAREVLGFLKTRFPVYHLSNIFRRDIQYGIRAMLAERGTRVSYADAERIAGAFTDELEREKILVPIDRQSWVVHYPEYQTPVQKRPEAPPAKKPSSNEPGPKAG